MADCYEESRAMCEASDFRTLYWLPMMFENAMSAELLLDGMLKDIRTFHATESSGSEKNVAQKFSSEKEHVVHKRRAAITGNGLNSSSGNNVAVSSTPVEIVPKSDNTIYMLLSVLSQHFQFSQLRDFELRDVINVMKPLHVKAGEVIIRQGDVGDKFYILEEGRCEALIGEMRVKVYEEPGSAFGDLALMNESEVRAATVRSTEECILWTLDRVFFVQAKVASSSNQNVQLSQFLAKSQFFGSLNLSQFKLDQLTRSLTKETFDDGTNIIKQGDVGQTFYLIFKGQVRITKANDLGVESFLTNMKEGDIFGERALINKETRKANVIAEGPVECYSLQAAQFYSLLGEFVDQISKANEFRVLRRSAVLSSLSDTKLKEVISLMKKHVMFSGQRVVCGHKEVYVVIDGVFEAANTGEVFKNPVDINIGTLRMTADLSAGALTLNSDEGMLCSITKDLIETAIAEDAVERSRVDTDSSLKAGSILVVEEVEKEIQVTTLRRQSVMKHRRQSLQNAGNVCESLEGIEVIQKAPLGKGTFGSVYLCKRRGLDAQGRTRLVALKCLDKGQIISKNQQTYIQREVIALNSLQHPFICEYYGVVVTPRKICFVLEYLCGGELWSYLYENKSRQVGPFGGCTLRQATSYAAIVVLALEHIHGLGYAYRDLKPENLLLTSTGYLKLVDFGFAKQVPFIDPISGQVQYRTFTLCGSPDYMAPELVQIGQGHDKSVDFWAYGVLLYELICRFTPFEGFGQQKTFENIVHSQKHLAFPSDFNPHTKSLIRRLLNPKSALRVGTLQNGVDEIKTHAFFTSQNVDFDALLRQEVRMEYVPSTDYVTSSTSTSSVTDVNFDLESERNWPPDEVTRGYDVHFGNFATLVE